MPLCLEVPVLSVDANAIHRVNTYDPESLFVLWTVFSKCAYSLGQGRRLENLSWRLWHKELRHCVDQIESSSPTSTSVPASFPRSRLVPDVPQLSTSVESAISFEDEDENEVAVARDSVCPRVERQDSFTRLRTQLSSEDLEKMVLDIVKSNPLVSLKMDAQLPPRVVELPQTVAPPREESASPVSVAVTKEKADELPPPALDRTGSETTQSTCKSMTEEDGASSPVSQPASSVEAFPSQQQQQPLQRPAMTLPVRQLVPSVAAPARSTIAPAAPLAQQPVVVAADAQTTPLAAPKLVLPKKQPRFEVGGSSGDSLTDDQSGSSGSASSRDEPQQQQRKPAIASATAAAQANAAAKKTVFLVGGSSEEDSSPKHPKSALHTSGRQGSLLTAQKKQTSFSNKITTRTIPTVVHHHHQSAAQRAAAVSSGESETEGDDVDESAIDDDDDSSDWEDSVEDASGKSSIDEKFFKRIDSSANLTSRRSLITLALEQSERAKKLGGSGIASQSSPALQRSRTAGAAAGAAGPAGSSPNDSDDSPLTMKRGTRPPLKPITEVTRTAAQPIVTTNSAAAQSAAAAAAAAAAAQGPLSPRSTRRNMLATELTASLRRHLVWERQQKTSTLNAVLKRRHTSHDVQNLRQYPEQPYIDRSEDVNASSWNADLSKDIGGYHSKGW